MGKRPNAAKLAKASLTMNHGHAMLEAALAMLPGVAEELNPLD